MAKDNTEKIEVQRTYNVPLRKEFQKAPKYRRAKKAVIALKAFLVRHMKSENVKLGKYVNEAIWSKGIKNPPHHVKVNVAKYQDGKVFAELVGATEDKKTDKKAAKRKSSKTDKKSPAPEEKRAKAAEKKEAPATDTKEE